MKNEEAFISCWRGGGGEGGGDGVKRLRTGGGLKNFRTGEGVTNLGGLLLLSGVSNSLHGMNTKINSSDKVIFSFLEDLKTTLNTQH